MTLISRQKDMKITCGSQHPPQCLLKNLVSLFCFFFLIFQAGKKISNTPFDHFKFVVTTSQKHKITVRESQNKARTLTYNLNLSAGLFREDI